MTGNASAQISAIIFRHDRERNTEVAALIWKKLEPLVRQGRKFFTLCPIHDNEGLTITAESTGIELNCYQCGRDLEPLIELLREYGLTAPAIKFVNPIQNFVPEKLVRGA